MRRFQDVDTGAQAVWRIRKRNRRQERELIREQLEAFRMAELQKVCIFITGFLNACLLHWHFISIIFLIRLFNVFHRLYLSMYIHAYIYCIVLYCIVLYRLVTFSGLRR